MLVRRVVVRKSIVIAIKLSFLAQFCASVVAVTTTPLALHEQHLLKFSLNWSVMTQLPNCLLKLAIPDQWAWSQAELTLSLRTTTQTTLPLWEKERQGKSLSPTSKALNEQRREKLTTIICLMALSHRIAPMISLQRQLELWDGRTRLIKELRLVVHQHLRDKKRALTKRDSDFWISSRWFADKWKLIKLS